MQFPDAPAGYVQQTLVAQLAETVFAGFRPGFFFVIIMTALILVLAANTAFNGFPVLGSILSQDRYLPRQLHTRGDRLAFSNGIVVLAAFAVVLVVGVPGRGHAADPALHRGRVRLVHAQPDGHGPALAPAPGAPRPIRRSAAGCAAPRRSTASARSMTGVVLVTVLVTKFLLGAWIAIVGDGRVLRAHAGDPAGTTTASRRSSTPRRSTPCCPRATTRSCWSRRLHKPTLRALALRPRHPPRRAGGAHGQRRRRRHPPLVREWENRAIPVPLKVLESPYREITRPVLDYVKRLRDEAPARRRHGVHPRVRRRPLVGAAAAQPERAAAQSPAAVPAGRDGGTCRGSSRRPSGWWSGPS